MNYFLGMQLFYDNDWFSPEQLLFLKHASQKTFSNYLTPHRAINNSIVIKTNPEKKYFNKNYPNNTEYISQIGFSN